MFRYHIAVFVQVLFWVTAMVPGLGWWPLVSFGDGFRVIRRCEDRFAARAVGQTFPVDPDSPRHDPVEFAGQVCRGLFLLALGNVPQVQRPTRPLEVVFACGEQKVLDGRLRGVEVRRVVQWFEAGVVCVGMGSKLMHQHENGSYDFAKIKETTTRSIKTIQEIKAGLVRT